jgi:dienelactone hydrolase
MPPTGPFDPERAPIRLRATAVSRAVARISFRAFVPVFAALLFFGAMFWAKGRDPFHRIWFSVKAPGYGKAECVAVLPKTAARPLPVVVYLHGSGGSLLTSGNELRQMAEMGLAAVGMEYNQTNEVACDAQFTALLGWVQRQVWADTNRIAWVGFSLGAQRQLAFALGHPGAWPILLVRVSGGWVPELEKGSATDSVASVGVSPNESARRTETHALAETTAQASGPAVRDAQQSDRDGRAPHCSALLIHGGNDEVFPVADARRLAGVLQSNGVPVELKVVSGASHGFEPDRMQVFRVIGEYCLTHLESPGALGSYRSILSWQAQARPLWLFWIPAFLWAAVWVYARSGNRNFVTMFFRPQPPLRPWEVALRWVAGLLAAAALADTALHLVPPRLAIAERTLAIARQHLIQPKEAADFDFLAANPGWRGKRLRTLLEHVELANYNRELIDWKLDDRFYRDFVLTPQIDAAADGQLDWRRPLWESFYPRIRKQPTPDAAAEIVARYLRERVTVAEGNNWPQTIAAIWQRQVSDACGFEAVYVAAMRAVGVPSRLNAQHRAEYWSGSNWRPAPRPIMDRPAAMGRPGESG